MEIRAGESVSSGLKRVAREQADHAIPQLTKPGNHVAAVFKTRKCIKKLRALLHLIQPHLGKKAANENRRLRDLGRTLATSRDTAAMVETFDGLAKAYPAEMGLNRFAAVRAHLVSTRDLAATSVDETALARATIAELQKLKRRVNLWRLPGDGFPVVAQGFDATWQKGRKAFIRVRKHPSSANFHELRKRAKDHWFQVRLMAALWPANSERYQDAMQDLQETLGDANNVAVLLQTVDWSGIGSLRELAERWRDHLRGKALKAATRIYAARSRCRLPRDSCRHRGIGTLG